MRLVMLGSGTSTGVPRIGMDWGDCDPAEPRNRRSRVSVMVETDGGTRILIDTAPDLREQCLREHISEIDAVLWTHDHADHCHGIDDLRLFAWALDGPVPGFGVAETMSRLLRRFDYVFTGNRGYPAIATPGVLDSVQRIGDAEVRHVQMPHGPGESTGFRIEAHGRSLVYATDFSRCTDAMLALFADCDVLVIDCLRRTPHPTHSHLEQSLAIARDCRAGRTVLTHLDKSMDYATLRACLPEGVEPGHDGLVLTW